MLTALLAACSDEQPGNGANPADGVPEGCSRIRLELSAGTDPSTRAPWDDKSALDKEMMKTALVIMVKENDKGDPTTVERIIPVDMDGTIWYERHSVATTTVENGQYTFYSFGNIPYTYTAATKPEENNKVTINGIEFEETRPLPAAVETATWTADYNNEDITALAGGIPMSNKQSEPVSSTRTVTLYLFRMLSKINFEFTNATDADINIQKITLHQTTPDGTPIFFLPPKNGSVIINSFPPTAPPFTNDSVKFVDEKATPPQAFDVLKAAPGADPVKVTKTFYMNECASQHATGQMPLTLLMQRDGKQVEERFALMRLLGIARNDNVFVPITLTDYVMKLKAFAYAPIGGYPPYTLEEAENEFFCTFSTGGDFALRPSMYKYEDEGKPENWFELTDKTKVQDFTITYHDPDNIFTTAPHFEGGEIRGTLKTATPPFKGTASVDLKVMLKTGTDGSVLQEYTRTLYIILNQK